MIGKARILCGDVRQVLPTLPSESVQCCVTSPPYWGLRDYGCEGQLGLERTPEEYVANMVAVFREVRRVLRDDGVMWLNLGDSYMGGGRGGGAEDSKQRTNVGSLDAAPNMRAPGFKHKDLVGIPWAVAFALRADGWYLRSDVIWSKPNPMPESVEDRPTKAHEYLFLLTKSDRYFYDKDAILEPHKAESLARYEYGLHVEANPAAIKGSLQDRLQAGVGNTERMADFINPAGRNRRTVWTIATQPYSGAHFAVMPEALVEPCILAGTSDKGACAKCGDPWEREVERVRTLDGEPTNDLPPMRNTDKAMPSGAQGVGHWRTGSEARLLGWSPSCDCGEQQTRPCVVLDPFAGSGTVGVVALKRGREFIGIELNPKYAQLALERINGDAPLLNRAEVGT